MHRNLLRRSQPGSWIGLLNKLQTFNSKDVYQPLSGRYQIAECSKDLSVIYSPIFVNFHKPPQEISGSLSHWVSHWRSLNPSAMTKPTTLFVKKALPKWLWIEFTHSLRASALSMRITQWISADSAESSFACVKTIFHLKTSVASSSRVVNTELHTATLRQRL